MVKIDNLNNQSTNTNQTSADQPTSTLTKKEDSSIIKTIGQLLPLAPFVFEQFTGQKIPQMSGTMADISLSLQQIQLSLQSLANNQQTLSSRITNLENSAVQQLTSLTHQFNSLRLTHTREKKEIEYNPNPNNQVNEDY
jgi:phospholipase/lecithinase/hemolysin